MLAGNHQFLYTMVNDVMSYVTLFAQFAKISVNSRKCTTNIDGNIH